MCLVTLPRRPQTRRLLFIWKTHFSTMIDRVPNRLNPRAWRERRILAIDAQWWWWWFTPPDIREDFFRRWHLTRCLILQADVQFRSAWLFWIWFVVEKWLFVLLIGESVAVVCVESVTSFRHRMISNVGQIMLCLK